MVISLSLVNFLVVRQWHKPATSLYLHVDYVYHNVTDVFQEIMQAIDLDSSGSLSFDEFLLAMPGNKHISQDEHK